MKKTLAFVCILSMFSFVGCGSSTDNSKEITSVKIETTESQTQEIELVTSTETSEVEKTTEAVSDEVVSNITTTEKATEKPTSAKAALEEQLIWEFDNVKVYAKGIENGITGPEIKLLVENNSDKDISIYTDYVIINDFMVSDISAIEVTHGNKVNDEITVLKSYLDEEKIDTIRKVEMKLHAREEDSFDIKGESEHITLYTSDYDENAPAPEFSGTTLVDQNGVKIVGLGLNKSLVGSEVQLYIENYSGKDISVYADDVAVNGFMVDGLLADDVVNGKKAIATIDFLRSELEENGITSISDVELVFRVRSDDYDILFETGKIRFNIG